MSFQVSRGIGWLAVALTLVAGCRKSEQSAQGGGGGGPRAVPVSVAEVVTRDVPVYIDEIGRCVPSEMVAIQSQASGRITEIHFKDGADVKRDQMLFTIDPRPYQAAVAQAEASLAENVATLSLMKSEFERVQGLLQSNAISREQFEQRKNGVAVSEAQVEASEAAIETSKVNLEYCHIKSPIDGLAGQRLVDLGNLVSPQSGQTLLTITKLNPIYADFTIPESRLGDVRKFMAENTLKTLVTTPDDASRRDTPPREGALTFLNNSVEQNTGTVKLRATLKNEDRYFWPGQLVQVRLVLQELKGATLVPGIATQISQTGPYVFVVGQDNKAELRPVKLGQRQGDMVVVLEGLKPNERVVTVGHMMVTNGGDVMVMPPPGQAQAPPAGQPAPAATQPAASQASK